MTPAEVAALLDRHGLAPNWRKPIVPAPIMGITERRGVRVEAHDWRLFKHLTQGRGRAMGVQRGRTWT
jgi:hypothetical protein